MKPQLIVIDTVEGVRELKAYLADKEFIAFDQETTGTSKHDQVVGFSVCAEESKAFYVILQKWSPELNTLLPMSYPEEAREVVASLVGRNLLMHNGVFDAMMAEAYFKVRLIESLHTCTMVLAHLLNENRKVGLKELATDYFGNDAKTEQAEMKASVLANGGVLTKELYEMFKADSYLLGKYGAKDAWLTYRLFFILVEDLFEQKLDKFFYEDESMPLLRGPTYELNTVGLQVDLKSMSALKTQLKAECAEAKSFIYQEITPIVQHAYPGTKKKTTFNIGSSQQLSWLLFGELKLEFGVLTDAGKIVCKQMGLKLPYTPAAKRDFIAECTRRIGEIYQPAVKTLTKTIKEKKIKAPWAYIKCDKATLTKLAPRYEWIVKLLEYQKKMKILSTYIEGIESRVRYGVINPSFLQHGTTSGRYSSRGPNFQNLPRDDQRVKNCFTARPGKVFVGADYSQLEPRTFAYMSQDKELIASFTSADDFYSTIGMRVFGKTDCSPRKDGSPDAFGIKYKKLRDLSKVIALASTYGATAQRLSSTTGKSPEDTQMIIDDYFQAFPGVKQMMLDSHKQAKSNGFVINLFGRPRRMPEAKSIPKGIDHESLPYEARNLLNLAVNHRIQATAASIVNRAAIKFHTLCQEANIECSLVCQVHDELIAECDEKDAENVVTLLQYSMEYTTILEGVPLEAIPRITKTLAK